jgi:opacity protein-like surface antigen
MKKIVLLTFLFVATLANAQQVSLVEVFNKKPAEERNGISIKKVNGKWVGHSTETEQTLSVKINAAGTFLEIKDPGTGGGVTTFQLKIFKDNAGTAFIAHNKCWTDGVMGEGGFSFTYAKTGEDATMAVFPDMEEKEFFKEGETKEGFEEYFTREYGLCNIPETGNTLEIVQSYAGINAACINEDKTGCDLKKKLKAKLVLSWSKEHDMFMPAN